MMWWNNFLFGLGVVLILLLLIVEDDDVREIFRELPKGL